MIINNIEFARKALEFHDTIAVSQLLRLRDVIASDKGELDWHLQGSVDEMGRQRLKIHLRGQLQLTCQRCLEEFTHEVDMTSGFIVVADESAIPSEEEDSGDEDYLVADTQMQVLELVEDEVLLALPIAPMHADACTLTASGKAESKPSPFAVLEGLKARKHQN